MFNTLLLNTTSLLADAEFLALLDSEENQEPTAAPAPVPTSPAPNAKELNGFYTGKATQYAHNYDADFLAFAQKELPDAFDLWVTNVDSFVVRHRNGAIMMLEIKRNGYACKEHQARTIALLSAMIDRGHKALKGNVPIVEGGKRKKMKVGWYGYNVLTLSNDSFENSAFLWNGKPISRQMLISVLAMETRF